MAFSRDSTSAAACERRTPRVRRNGRRARCRDATGPDGERPAYTYSPVINTTVDPGPQIQRSLLQLHQRFVVWMVQITVAGSIEEYNSQWYQGERRRHVAPEQQRLF